MINKTLLEPKNILIILVSAYIAHAIFVYVRKKAG